MKKLLQITKLSSICALAILLALTEGCVGMFGGKDKPPSNPNNIDLFAPVFVAQFIGKEFLMPKQCWLSLEVKVEDTPVILEKFIQVYSYKFVLPNLGEINCEGLTLRQLEDKLTEAYGKLHENPLVKLTSDYARWGRIGIIDYQRLNGQKVYMTIPSQNGLSLTHLFRYDRLRPDTDRSHIQVTRSVGPEDLPQFTETITQVKTFDYDAIVSGQIPDPPLVKNDVVHIFKLENFDMEQYKRKQDEIFHERIAKKLAKTNLSIQNYLESLQHGETMDADGSINGVTFEEMRIHGLTVEDVLTHTNSAWTIRERIDNYFDVHSTGNDKGVPGFRSEEIVYKLHAPLKAEEEQGVVFFTFMGIENLDGVRVDKRELTYVLAPGEVRQVSFFAWLGAEYRIKTYNGGAFSIIKPPKHWGFNINK